MTAKEMNKAYAHWLYQAAGMGNRGLLRKMERIGTPQEIYEMAVSGQLEERMEEQMKELFCGNPASKYRRKAAQITEAAMDCDVVGDYEQMSERGISFLSCKDEDFPQKLASIPDPPYAIYYVGRLPEEHRQTLAVIGARNCSEYGRYMARKFCEELAASGVQIVSGMARGIDGIAQTAALDAGGYSLGVLGCGVDVCYPAEHRELYERLIAEGGICSEYPQGIEPRAMLFPPRNRIISGWCDGVLVIEAKERSGTLITVDMALEQGREVYALPGRATDPLSAGCHKLIRQGAELISSPQQLLRGIQNVCRDGCRQERYEQQELFISVEMEGLKGELLRILDFQPKSLDQMQAEYDKAYGKSISIPDLCGELLRLCVDGYAGQVGGGCYVRKK